MLKDIKKTSKHTSIYAFGNIASKVVGFILLPLYTNEVFLSQDDFGTLAILEATVQVLTTFLSFALANSLTRWYWDDEYKDKQKQIVFTILTFLAITNIPILSTLTIKASFFSELIFKSTSYTYLLQLTFITVLLRIFNVISSQLLQLQHKSSFYSAIHVIKLVITLVLTILAVTKYERGVEGIWEATIIGEGLILLATAPFVLKNIYPRLEWKIFKEMLAYSSPLVLSNLAVITLTVTDRYMLHYMSGLAATGIYSLGLRLANTLKITVTDSLLSALAPIRMKKFNEPNNHRFFSKILTYSSFVFIIVLLGVSLFSLEGIKLITKTQDYWSAAGIISILSFAFLFSLMRLHFTTGLTIKRNSKVLGLLTFISAIINFGLNLVLIPRWDINGAAAATLLSQAVYMCLTYLFAQKSYRIPYELVKLLKATLLAALIIVISNLISEVNIIPRLLIKIGLFTSYPFALYYLKFYDQIEVDNIKQIFKAWRDPKKVKENMNRFLK